MTIARQGKAKLFKFHHPWQGTLMLLQSGMAMKPCGQRAMRLAKRALAHQLGHDAVPAIHLAATVR